MEQFLAEVWRYAWKVIAAGGGGLAILKLLVDLYKNRQATRQARDSQRTQAQARFESTMLETAQGVVSGLGSFLEELLKANAACEERCRARDDQVRELETKVVRLEKRIESLLGRSGGTQRGTVVG